MFLRKHWIPLSVFLVAIIGVCLYMVTTQTPKEPIKIYKTTVVEKPKQPQAAIAKPRRGHFHTDGTYHAAPEKTDVSDWQDDAAFEAPPPTSDPWQQNAPEPETTVAETDDDAYPPKDWYKTKDPELRAKYLLAQLINQFGDTPEVQAIGDYELKTAKRIPPTVDEHLSYLEAHYHLFPNEYNRRTLNNFRKVIASGDEIIFK